MKLRSLVIAMSALLLAGCDGNNGEVDFKPLIQKEIIRTHVAFLADDALQGRFSFEPGYQIAANYVASQYAQMGLKPVGDNGTYMQAVPFLRYKLKAETMQMSLSIEGEEQELVPDEDFRVDARAFEELTSFEGDLVYVGYGVEAPELGHDDYAELDVEGKIVVTMYGVPGTIPEDQRGLYGNAHKQRVAHRHGALGLVRVFDHRKLAEGQTERKPRVIRPQVTRSEPDGSIEAPVPGFGGMVFVTVGAIAPLFSAVDLDVAAIRGAIRAGEPVPGPKPLPGHLSVSYETEMLERPTSNNVVGMLAGSDPALKDEYVIISAHLDHLRNSSKDPGDLVRNGAIDNAIGVAAMLETARLFKKSQIHPRRSILFIALTGEELGLQGSGYFADYPTIDGEAIVANINIDMPLLMYNFADVVGFGAEHSSLGASLDRAASQLNISVSPDPMPKMNIFHRSDHYSFVKKGIPALMLMVGFTAANPEEIDGGEVFADFMQNHYHSASDGLNQPIDYDAAVKFTHLNWLIVNEIANEPTRPSWNEGSIYGQTKEQ